ncbi:MAG: AAA family ATPase [Actinomycetota bacterium]
MGRAGGEPGLVGRELELKRLDAVLGKVSSGPAFVEIVGEPGIGKTRLLDALTHRAEQQGVLVLRGRAAQFERSDPFQVFVDALDDYLRTLNLDLFRTLEDTVKAELAGVFPALRSFDVDVEPALDVERFRAHHAVRTLLELLARKPLLVELDDLHWADEASQELLSFLLRRPPRGPVLICMAYRPAQAPPRLVQELVRAVAADVCQRVELGPLERGHASELLGETVPARMVDALYEESGGNPFYIQQLARTRFEQAGSGQGHETGELPRSVLVSIREELDALREPERALLDGASVAGDPFDLDLARDAAGLQDEEFLPALDALIEKDLVRTAGAPRRFRFRHPIVRNAVYNTASAGWRLAAHARAAGALASQGASAAERAHHIERSAKKGDEGAVSILREAGAEAMGRAPAAAAHWFEAALRILPGEGSNPRQIELLLPLAVSLGAAGRLAESRDALRKVLGAIPPQAIRERVEAAVACSMVENFLSRHAEARELLMSSFSGVPDGAVVERATLHLALANLGCLSNDWEEVERQARAALEIVAGTHSPTIEAAATILLALQPVRLGRLSEAPALIDRAAALTDSLTDAQLAERLETLAWLFTLELFAERADDAIRHAEHATRVARGTGQSHLLPLLMMGRNWSISFQGRLREADEGWQEMLEICLLTGNSEFEAWALAGQTLVATEQGDRRRGAQLAERTVEAAAACRGEQIIAYAHVYPARYWLEVGEHERAKRLILEGAGGPELTQAERVWQGMSWSYLARCELAVGDLEAAEYWIEKAEAVAEEVGLAGRRGWASTARARLELAQGRPGPAAETAARAASECARGGFLIDSARARLVAGQALAASGEVERAAQECRRAYQELDLMGAQGYRDEAARSLRMLGTRVPRRGGRGAARSGVDALSQREREVADLVMDGRTNREIAEVLHISEKTVEKRLSTVFEKLDVANRAAVASKLARTASSDDPA